MTVPWFSQFLTVPASTKRSPAPTAGKISEKRTYLTGLYIVPLVPVSPDVAMTMPLNSPREGKETYLPAADIVEGDHLVVSSIEYVVRAVAEWADETPGGVSFVRLVVEEIK